MKTTLLLISLIFSCSQLYGQEELLKQVDELPSPDTTIYSYLPSMPQFGKTKEALQDFIVKESRYPAATTQTATTKNVFVQVIIGRDGKVTFDRIAKGVDEKLDAEAERIARAMPPWSVGKLQDGRPASVRMIFPVWFK